MADLRDFFQGMSNSAASTVTAPVDGIAWLLKKAGLDIQNPVGGSDWMTQKGLLAQPENRNMGLLGEAIGGVAPMLAAAKAPQIASGLLSMADNAMAPTTLSKQAGVVRVGQKPGSTWLAAQSDNGLVGGHVRDGALHISHADLAEAARGKGEGVKLYQSLVDDALAKGLSVFSDSTVEGSAVRMYEALGRRGYDVQRLPGGVLEDGAAYGAGASSPAFKVSKLASQK